MTIKNKDVFFALTKIHSIDFYETMPENNSPSSVAVLPGAKIILFIPESLLVKEKVRLQKALEKTLKNLENTETQLSNKDFIARAPKELLEEKQSLLKSLLETKLEIESKLSSL